MGLSASPVRNAQGEVRFKAQLRGPFYHTDFAKHRIPATSAAIALCRRNVNGVSIATPLDIAAEGVPSLAGNAAGSSVLAQQLSLHSPVGDLTISEDGGAIVSVDWGWASQQASSQLLQAALRQLHAYFDGNLVAFDLPIAPKGTPYQRKVWDSLCAIPAGQTRTYAEIARSVGGSPRAVGGANGRNPIPIIIPCHRVVATIGLGGYSGGDGLPTKRYLLALEGADQVGDLLAPHMRA